MSRQDVASLVLKLLGVFLLAQWIPYAGSILTTLKRESFFIAGVPFLLMGIVGVVLIAAAGPLSRRLTADAQPSDAPGPLSIAVWQAIAFSAIGVSVLASGLHRLAGLAAMHLVENQSIWPSVVSPALQVVVGVALFLQAKGLAGVWRRLQESRPMRGGPSPEGNR